MNVRVRPTSTHRFRWFVAVLVAALLAGACGADDDSAIEPEDSDPSAASSEAPVEEPEPDGDQGAGEDSPEPEPESAEPQEAEPEPEPEEPEPQADPEFRTIEHLFGTTDVPFRPERVVVLRTHMALHLLSVGINPAGIPADFDFAGVLDGESEAAEEAFLGLNAALGFLLVPDADLNPEAIAALNPDLIIMDERRGEDTYELLSNIAATVVTEWPDNGSWKLNFDQTVTAAGADEDAIAEVRARYDALLEQVPASAADTELSFIRGARGDFRMEVENTFGGSVGAEAGFAIDDGGATDIPPDGQIFFSPERLSVVDGDLIVTQDGGFNGIDFLKESALWDELPAVQAGRIVEISPQIYNGGSYVAAELLLKALIDATS